jgi:hypothetical protein
MMASAEVHWPPTLFTQLLLNFFPLLVAPAAATAAPDEMLICYL